MMTHVHDLELLWNCFGIATAGGSWRIMEDEQVGQPPEPRGSFPAFSDLPAFPSRATVPEVFTFNSALCMKALPTPVVIRDS